MKFTSINDDTLFRLAKSEADFSETDTFDFARCQRPDGSYYGTGGQCRKGTPVDAKEKRPLKERYKKGEEIGAGAYGAVVSTEEGTVIKKGLISEAEIQISDRLKDIDGVPSVLAHEFIGKTTDDKYDPVKGLIEMETAKGLPLGEQTLSKKDQAKAIDEYIRLRKEIHMKGVAHNDFHDNNFFYDQETGKGGAIDFGLSRMSRREALREAFGTGRMEMDIQSHFLMQGMPTTPKLTRLNKNIAQTQQKMLAKGYSDIDVIRGTTTVAEAKSFVSDIYKGI